MTREFLKNLGVEDATIDKILDENMADIGKEKRKTDAAEEKLATANNDLTTARNELDALKKSNGDIASVQKQLEDLQAKYEKDTGDLTAKLAERDYSDAITQAIAKKELKFSSKSAQKAFESALREKKLELKDGELSGLDDFIKAQRESDPDAFAPEKPAPTFAQRPVNSNGGNIKTAGETLAEAMGKASAQQNKISNDIISMYTNGGNT